VNFLIHFLQFWKNDVPGNKMTSQEAANDLEILLAMDIKLRLLDVEGMDLPEEPPPIPAEPTNFDFPLDVK
jgi:engulfment and cell motility protein 1